MKTLSIRELSGSTLTRAASEGQTIGITNDRVLCAVLIPVSQRWVDQLVNQNLSRILRGVELGEKELSNGEFVPALDDLMSLVQSSAARGGDSSGSLLRRVSVRELSGALLEEAARQGQALAVTNNRVLAAVLVPVTQRWVDQLVDQNLSRILHGIELGDAAAAAGTSEALDAVESSDESGSPRPETPVR